MNAPGAERVSRHLAGVLAAVFLIVVAAELVLIKLAGTDIPFHDQWGIEGSWLYPAWREGRLHFADLLQPFNGHRIFWTHVLNLGLFEINGQWDPLVQLVAGALLRAGCAVVLAYWWCRGTTSRAQAVVATGIIVAYLPFLAWHTVLWGIETHAFFALGFSLLTMMWLGAPEPSASRIRLGLAAGVAAQFAMGPGTLAPVAVLGLAVLCAIERRTVDRRVWRQAWPALLLLALAWSLRVSTPHLAALQAPTIAAFLEAAGRMLAWPHVGQPWAALAMNLPLALLVAGRINGRRKATTNENAVLLAAGWSFGISLAAAWTRGGSPEFFAGVPSRYVDFVVLLPLANLWGAVVLAGEVAAGRRTQARVMLAAWSVFLLVGWLGLTTETMRGIILPRARDTEAPVRLARAFQLSGDANVFAGQPRLLVPHPDPESVRAVLNDPRMQGKLPPSLQPERPMGPLSRAVRWLLGR